MWQMWKVHVCIVRCESVHKWPKPTQAKLHFFGNGRVDKTPLRVILNSAKPTFQRNCWHPEIQQNKFS